MSDSLIQWPSAKYWTKPWNPILGCVPCSPACDHCYAKAAARRFGLSFEPHEQSRKCPRKGVVFAGNMTDLFGDWVELPQVFKWFFSLFHFDSRIGANIPNDATYLFLTKRAERMALALAARYGTAMPHCLFGVTAENQECHDRRVPYLRHFSPHIASGWLSAEPLLGPVDLGLRYIAPEDMPFEWVVVGCESGRGRRPCRMEWVESIVGECLYAGVPVFVKQLDIGGKCVTDINQFPGHLRIRQVPWAQGGGECT